MSLNFIDLIIFYGQTKNILTMPCKRVQQSAQYLYKGCSKAKNKKRNKEKKTLSPYSEPNQLTKSILSVDSNYAHSNPIQKVHIKKER